MIALDKLLVSRAVASVKTQAQAPARSRDQRMEALQRANDIRVKRAQLKRDLKNGDADIEKILKERKLGAADYVLSGLPFSTLPPGVGDAIAKATSKVIRPGGAFLVYQFSPKVLDFIKPHFDDIKRGFEWINVPPATLFWAYKRKRR